MGASEEFSVSTAIRVGHLLPGVMQEACYGLENYVNEVLSKRRLR